MLALAPPPRLRRLVIADPLDPWKRECTELDIQPASTVLEFCPPELFDHPNLVVVHNGRAANRTELSGTSARAGDSLVFAIGLGGKNAGFAIGGLALLAGIGILTGGFGVFAAPEAAGTLAKIGLGIALFGGATVLNSAAQALLSPKVKTDAPTAKKGIEDSPTYNIDGVANTYAPGIPIAIPYGKERVGGQVIQQSLEVNAEGGSTLKMLVSLGHGPIQGIGGITTDTEGLTGDAIPTDIELNGTPAKNFKGVRVSMRMGTFNQAPIAGFNEVVTSQGAGLATLLSAAPQTLTTTSVVESFQVNLYFPAGLYNTTTTGNKQAYTVQYWVRWRETGNGDWFQETVQTVTKNQAAAFSTSFRKDSPLGLDASGAPIKRILDIQLERITVDDASVSGSFPVSTLQWNTLNEIVSGDLSYPGLALVGFEITAQDQLLGTVPVCSVVRQGRKLWVWDGISTTDPAFSQLYTDGNTTKDNQTDPVDGGWLALRAAVGPPIVNEKIGFSFIQSGTRALNLVALKLRRSSTSAIVSGNLFVQIESTSGSNPSGVALATSANVACSTVTSGGGFVYFGFTTPATLTNGVKYHAILYATYTPSATVNIQVGTSNKNPVGPNGDLEYFTNPAWTLDSTRNAIGFAKYRGQTPGENPAWWLLDFLTNKTFGLGAWVTLDDIDLDSLLAWAQYNDECIDANGGVLNSFRWAGGLTVDFESSGWDLALKIAALGRAALTKIGRKILVIIDRPASPTQLFTEGNVVKDSVKLSTVSVEDRPNRIEIQYRNEDTSYNSDVAVKEDETALAAGDAYRTEGVNLFGLTAAWRAYRAAKYRINQAKTNKRMVSFTASLDSVAILPGDVFSFQHYLQDDLSYGGRVYADVSGGAPTSIDLDRTIDITSQRIKVRTKGTGAYVLQERTISSVSTIVNSDTGASFARVSVTSAFTGGDLPKANDPYVATNATTSTRDYRCVAMKASSDMDTVEIMGIEYNASVYNDDPGAIETFTDSLPNPMKMDNAQAVANITLREVHQQSGDGTLRSAIEVGFDKPRGWNHVDIYYRVPGFQGGLAWTFAGSTWTSSFLITEHIETGVGYMVAAVAVTRAGAQQAIEDAPFQTIFITGPFGAPSDVTGFTVQTAGTFVCLFWDPAADANPTIDASKNVAAPGAVDGYQIRLGDSWAAGRIVQSLASGNFLILKSPGPGAWKFWIVAVTRAGVESRTPAFVSITIGEQFQAKLVDRDEFALGFPGTRTNCTSLPSGLGATGSSATYEAPAQTGLTLARYRVNVDFGSLPYDTLETVAEWSWTIGSVYGDRRWVSGWNRNAFDPGDFVVGDPTGDFTLDSFFGRHWAIGAPADVENRITYTLEWALDTGGGYGAWTAFVSGDSAVFTAIKVRLTFTGDPNIFIVAPQQRALVDSLKFSVMADPIVDSGVIALAAGGSTINFNVAFPSSPKVIANIRLGAAGQNLLLSAIAANSFFAQVQTDAGAGVAKTIMWKAIL